MLKITYYGYSTIKIATDKMQIVFDPGIIDNNPLVSQDEEVDVICVSHVSPKYFGNVVELSKRSKAYLVGPMSVIDEAKQKGAQSWRLRPLKDGEEYPLQDAKITAFRLPIGPPGVTNQNENFGYIVEIDNLQVAYFGEAIGLGAIERRPVNIAFLPVGGKTMFDGKMALQVLNNLRPELAIPVAASSPDDASYVVEHHTYFSKATEIRIMEPNETIEAGWYVGKEFRIM